MITELARSLVRVNEDREQGTLARIHSACLPQSASQPASASDPLTESR